MEIKAIIVDPQFYVRYVRPWRDEEWYIIGVVKDHPDIPDGHHIRTSPIDYIERDEGRMIAATQNSLYLLEGNFKIPDEVIVLKKE